MSGIQITVPQLAGGVQGLAGIAADHERRLKTLEATRTQIGDGSLTTGMISTGFVIGSTNIGPNSIYTEHLTAGSVTAGVILAGSITAQQIQVGALTAETIAANAITATHIQADSINATHIQSNSIDTDSLQAGSITADKIVFGTITGDKILAGTILGSNIAAGAIAAANIQTGALDAALITGAYLRTSASDPRVVLGNGVVTSEGTYTGIVGTDGSGNVTFLIDAITGSAKFKGTVLSGSDGLGNISGVTPNAVLMTSGRGLANNGTFDDTDVTMYVGQGSLTVARDTTTYFTNPASLKLTATAAGTREVQILQTSSVKLNLAFNASGAGIAVSPVAPFSWSCVIFSAVARSVTLGIRWYNSGGTLLGTDTATAQSTIANQWKRFTIENKTCPATAFFGVPYITWTAVNGDIFYVDNVVFVQGPYAAASQVISDSITAADIRAASISTVELDASIISSGIVNATLLVGATYVTGSGVTYAGSGVSGIAITAAGLRAWNGSTKTVEITAAGAAYFSAQVNALGLTVAPATSLTTPGFTSQIQWLSGANVTSQLFGFYGTFGGVTEAALVMNAVTPTGAGDYGRVQTGWQNFTGTYAATLYAGRAAGQNANISAVTVNASGVATNWLNKDGGNIIAAANITAAVDIVAGRYLYVGGSGGPRWENSSGTMVLSGSTNMSMGGNLAANIVYGNNVEAITIIGGTSGGGGSIQLRSGPGYFQELYGIRVHNGGAAGPNSVTVYGGWTAPHVVYTASTGGTPYVMGYSYAALHSNYSDARTKTNIRDVYTDTAAAMARVRGLRPRRFDRHLAGGGGRDEVGFIAQEIEQVDPRMVVNMTMQDGVEGSHDVKVISPMEFIALLTSAVKDLDERLESALSRIAELEA